MEHCFDFVPLVDINILDQVTVPLHYRFIMMYSNKCVVSMQLLEGDTFV